VSAFLAEEGARLAGMGGLLVASAFFSGSETALFSLRRDHIRTLVGRSRRTGLAIRRLLARPERLLVSVLFGNLVVNVLYFSIGSGVALRAAGVYGRAAAAGVSVAVLLVLLFFGEILPKSLAASAPKAISTLAAWPLLFFHRAIGRPAGVVSSPVTRLVRRLARREPLPELEPGELRFLVELAERSGAVSGAEAEMLEAVVELSELRVREVMVPRVDVMFASVDDSPEQVLRRMSAETFSAAPVYEGGLDRIVGLVRARDLLAASAEEGSRPADLRALLKPVTFVPESARLAGVLEGARAHGFDVAVAVDEYGGTAGIVSLEDIAATVFGDMADEFDGQERPEVEQAGEGSFVLAGALSVREWAELFRVEPEPGQSDTLGGFVTHLLGRIPREGDVTHWGNLRFTVREMRKRRVERVELSLESGEAPGKPADAKGGPR
jgi:putative hemolysin